MEWYGRDEEEKKRPDGTGAAPVCLSADARPPPRSTDVMEWGQGGLSNKWGTMLRILLTGGPNKSISRTDQGQTKERERDTTLWRAHQNNRNWYWRGELWKRIVPRGAEEYDD